MLTSKQLIADEIYEYIHKLQENKQVLDFLYAIICSTCINFKIIKLLNQLTLFNYNLPKK